MLCLDACFVSMVVDTLWPAKSWSVLCITRRVPLFMSNYQIQWRITTRSINFPCKFSIAPSTFLDAIVQQLGKKRLVLFVWRMEWSRREIPQIVWRLAIRGNSQVLRWGIKPWLYWWQIRACWRCIHVSIVMLAPVRRIWMIVAESTSALGLTGGGEMLLQPMVMPPLTFTLDDMENELQHYSVKTPLMQKCLR